MSEGVTISAACIIGIIINQTIILHHWVLVAAPALQFNVSLYQRFICWSQKPIVIFFGVFLQALLMLQINFWAKMFFWIYNIFRQSKVVMYIFLERECPLTLLQHCYNTKIINLKSKSYNFTTLLQHWSKSNTL